MQQLKLLGGASVETDTGPVKGRPVQRKWLALLALLVVARSRGLSRDKLVAYLWPETDAENGRRFLSDSVYRINQALGEDTLVAAGDELRLDLDRVTSDVVLFEDALARGEMERAVALYIGPFLDGFFLPDAPDFGQWADGERARLSAAYGQALETLAITAETHGDRTGAILWWRRLAGFDPLNSRVALRLVQALETAGERAAAIQQARVHTALLREELGSAPDEAFTDYVEQIRSNPPPSESPVSRSRLKDATSASATPSVPSTRGLATQHPGVTLGTAENSSPSRLDPPTASESAASVRPADRRRWPAFVGIAAVIAVILAVVAVWLAR